MNFYLEILITASAVAIFQSIHWLGGTWAFRTRTWIAGWAYAVCLRWAAGFGLRAANIWNLWLELGIWLIALASLRFLVDGPFKLPTAPWVHVNQSLQFAIKGQKRTVWFLVALCTLYALLLAIGATLPSVLSPDWDAVDTWIPMYREYVAHHGFVVRPDLLYGQLAQTSRGLLTPLFAFFSGQGVKFFNVTTLLILSFGFVELAQLFFPRSFKSIGAWAFFLAFINPGLMQSSTVAYHDVLFLALLVALACEIWRGSFSPVLVGVLAGVAGGTKSVGYFQVGYICGVLYLATLMSKKRRWKDEFSKASVTVVIFVVVSFLIQLPVWILTGNPIFPLLSHFFHSPFVTVENYDRLSHLSHLSLLFTEPLAFFKELIWDIPGSTIQWTSHDYKTSPLLVGLPALGYWQMDRKPGMRAFPWVLATTMLYLLWQITNVDNRYLYPAYLFLIPAGALALSEGPRHWNKSIRLVVNTTVLLVFIFIVLQTMFQQKHAITRLLQRQSEEQFRVQHGSEGVLVSVLYSQKLYNSPKLLIGSQHIDLFGPSTYADELVRFGTGYLSIEKLISGDSAMITRFSRLGIHNVIVINSEGFESKRIAFVRDWLHLYGNCVADSTSGLLCTLRGK